jgi:hypothetical protein
MKFTSRSIATVGIALLLLGSFHADANTSGIYITEVAPWSSSTNLIGSDWFELSNLGSNSVNISGWKMDDNSFAFGSSVLLNGITNIAAGESVIFLETAANATIASFKNTWFGTNVPANLQFGMYSGSGVGLSTTADGVIIFNGSGVQQAKVSFGGNTGTNPYLTFDNAALLDNTTITTLATNGVNGAFAAANDANEIGSPGTISAVPEPSTYLLLGIGGLALLVAYRRRQA